MLGQVSFVEGLRWLDTLGLGAVDTHDPCMPTVERAAVRQSLAEDSLSHAGMSPVQS